MPEFVKPVAEWAAAGIEILGVGIIVGFLLVGLARGMLDLFSSMDSSQVTKRMRALLVRGILLGLEFLVAADIIHTVAVELTFESVGVLVIIVLVRTFLSFTLELELTGSWPWENGRRDRSSGGRGAGSEAEAG